jgi:long-chain acyl-CoA synthetase
VAEVIVELAAATPDAVAVADGDRRLSFAELAGGALGFAGRLTAWGLEPGDRVGLYAANSAEYLLLALGTWMAGGVVATVYPEFGHSELEYVLSNATPRILIAEPGRRSAAEAAVEATGVACEVYDLDVGGGQGLPDAPALVRPATLEMGAAGLICYTSGSTARPKPVTHSHRGIAGGCRAYAEVWHLSASDRTLVCLPMAWLYGLTTTALATLIRGGTVVSLPRYNPVAVVDAVSRERVTVFPGVTTMFAKLAQYVGDERPGAEMSSLRLCVSGGEPRNEPAFDRWRELTGCPVHDVYCASECWPVITYDPVAEPEPIPGSAGIVVPGSHMRVVDEAGAEVPAGETGHALWRAPGLMLGYWNEPELTARAFTDDGWYRSGDYVRVDPDGHVYVMGRASDLIIRGGSNVSPAEVELVLGRHPDVGEVVVAGVPDPVYGEQVAAAVSILPGGRFDADALKEFCAAELAPYKVPTVLRHFEELPRGATGKVARKEIAALLAADAAASATG